MSVVGRSLDKQLFQSNEIALTLLFRPHRILSSMRYFPMIFQNVFKFLQNLEIIFKSKGLPSHTVLSKLNDFFCI